MDYEKPLFFHVMQYARAADHDVMDMVSGNPDWEPPAAIRTALREYADGEPATFQYPPSPGLDELREAIARRRGVAPDQVVVTNGAGEANYLAMALALDRDAGDEVLMVDPVYSYYPGKTALLDGTQRFVSVGPDGRLDVAAVREAATEQTACIVVNSPNNPTGAVYSAETVRGLVAVAEEYDAILLADEVYDHFDLSGRFTSALAVDSPHRIVTNSFSKSMAITGFRVGYVILPPAYVDAATRRHMLVNVAGSRPAQFAVYRALCETEPAYYEANRDRLAGRVERFTAALDAAGAEYVRPDGAFYVLARFEGYPGTLENVERLVDEAGVAGMPGETFGDSCRDWIRFALVTPEVEAAGEALASYFG